MITFAASQDIMVTDSILETGQGSGKSTPKRIKNAIFVKNGYILLFSSILKDCSIFKQKLNHIINAKLLLNFKEKK